MLGLHRSPQLPVKAVGWALWGASLTGGETEAWWVPHPTLSLAVGRQQSCVPSTSLGSAAPGAQDSQDGHSLPSLGPPSPGPRPHPCQGRAVCFRTPKSPGTFAAHCARPPGAHGGTGPAASLGAQPLRPGLAGLHGRSPLGVAPETPTHTTVCE